MKEQGKEKEVEKTGEYQLEPLREGARGRQEKGSKEGNDIHETFSRKKTSPTFSQKKFLIHQLAEMVKGVEESSLERMSGEIRSRLRRIKKLKDRNETAIARLNADSAQVPFLI